MIIFLLALQPALSAKTLTYNSDFDLLKSHRTYFGITELDPPKHHFVVNFDHVDAVQIAIDVNSLDEISRYPIENLNGATGLVPSANSDRRVPEAFRAWEVAIIRRVKALFPKAHNIQTTYYGQFRRVVVEEIIPAGMIIDGPFKREAVKTRLPYRYFSEDGVLEPDLTLGFDASLHGYTRLLSARDGRADIKWLPIVLSPSLDGFSLVFPFERDDRLWASEHARYLEILKETIARIDSGTYQNPLDEVISRQGDTLFPSGYRGAAILEGTIYGRTENFQDQFAYDFSAPFFLDEASGGKQFKGVREIPEIQTTIRWTIDMDQRGLDFELYDSTKSDGPPMAKARYIIDADMVAEGGHVKIGLSSLRYVGAPGLDPDNFSLPARNGFTGIDFYFREMRPKLESGPVMGYAYPAPTVPWPSTSRIKPLPKFEVPADDYGGSRFQNLCRRVLGFLGLR